MSNQFEMWRDTYGDPVQALRIGATETTAVAAGSAKTFKLIGASANPSLIRVALDCSAGRAYALFGSAGVSVNTTNGFLLLPGVEVFVVRGTDGGEDYLSIIGAAGALAVSYTVIEG